MQQHWTVHAKERLYQGFFNMVRYRFSHALFGGGESPPLDREVLLRGDAAAVLIWDVERDEFLLVEQIRPGAFAHESGPWLTEIVAGMVGEGESPEEVVRREAREEADVEVTDLVPMLRYMPSPGGSSERLWLYLGRADLSKAGGVFGLPEEGEDIRAFCLPTADALARLERGEIDNSMSVIALQWWQLNRHKLAW